MNIDNRIQELIELAAQEGFMLPMPLERIIALEDAGHVVDLRTGEIVGTADDRVSLTPAAELRYWWLLPDVMAVRP